MERVFSPLRLAAFLAAALPAAAREAVAPARLAQPPSLDGKLDDPCWKQATRLPRFTHRGRPVEAETYAFVGYDDAALYVGVHCQEPLVKQMRRRFTRHDQAIWSDDSIELFLDTDPDRAGYLHLIANSVDGRQDGAHPSPEQTKVGMLYDLDWTSNAFVVADYWSVEFAVPFHTLNLPDRPAHDIGFCICRERYPVNEYCSWGGWFNRPDTFARLKGIRIRRDHSPLHVERLDLGEMLWGENELAATLVNLADDERHELALTLTAEGRVLDEHVKPLRLPRGKPIRVVQRYRVPPGTRPKNGYRLSVAIRRGADKRRKALPIAVRKFHVPSETIAAIALGGAGIYYRDAPAAPVQVRCFLSEITVRQGLLLDVSVRNAAGKEVYGRKALPFATQSHVHPLPLAALAEGWYRVRVAVAERASRKPLAEADLALRKVRGPFEP